MSLILSAMKQSGNIRVCVPVCVRRASEVAPAVRRAAEVADIIELRFDCLDVEQLQEAQGEIAKVMDEVRRPFIFTFRPAEEGGRRALGISERVEFWRDELLSINSERFQDSVSLDIELELLESAHWAKLSNSVGEYRLVCSKHDFEGVPADLDSIYRRMLRTPAGVLKLAVRAREITDCVEVLKLLERARHDGREMIAIAMGEAGLLTRVLTPARGAFLTYGALDAGHATAPGQVAAGELCELYRVHELDGRTQITGLVGSPVSHSLSPHIHNAAFAARGVNGVYIPFEVADLGAFMRRMAHPRTRELDWNLRGLSVTAPHKSAVMRHLDYIEPRAQEIGAVNTVVIEGDELRGYNTDAGAALEPLRGLVELRGARVAVLGAGGAARALLWALRECGARTTVFARNTDKAREVARAFDADSAALSGAAFDGFDVVVNATTLGTRGAYERETPVCVDQLRGARVAYDLVYNPSETRFLAEARAADCALVGGLAMLIAQAAEQFRLWTGTDAPLNVMRAAAEKRMLGIQLLDAS